MRNRTQTALLIFAGVVLAALVASSVGFWLSHPPALTIAVGPEGGPEQRFASGFAHLLEDNHASVRLTVQTHDTAAQALAGFTRHDADLAIIRTDAIPPGQARAVAVLDEEVLLLIGRRDSRFDSPGDLKGHKLAVLGEDGRNEALMRQILDYYDIDPSATGTVLRSFPPTTPIDSLLNGDYDFVATLEPLSRLSKTAAFEQLAQRMGGFTLHGLVDAKALQRRMSGLVDETIETGLLAAEPPAPQADIETVALQDVLVARSRLGEPTVAELVGLLFENRNELAVDRRFATNIEPPDLEKDALISAHAGAVQYLQGDVRSFVDRYSDLIYLLMSVGSIVGSVGLAFLSSLRRSSRPSGAEERTDALLDIAENIRAAASRSDLDHAEAALEAVYVDVVRGLRHGHLSNRGLEAFRMAYDHARHLLDNRRRSLPG